MKDCAFIIDSSAGINEKELSEKYNNSFLIPLVLILPNNQEVDDDDKNISYDKFYEILEKGTIKTSQIPLGKISKIWDNLLLNYHNIIFVGLSKGLSGQHNNLYALSQTDKYKDKVFVIDTDGVSQINKFIFNEIYNWVTKEKILLKDIQHKVDILKSKFCVFIVPKSLKTLKQGGRISPAAAALANILKIVPILKYDGQIDKFDKARTFKKAVILALNQIKIEHPKNKNIVLLYSKVQSEDYKLVKSILKDKKFIINEECQIPNVIVAHTGADTFSFISWDITENN